MKYEIDLIRIRSYELGQRDSERYGIRDNPYERGTIEYKAYEDGFWMWAEWELVLSGLEQMTNA